MNQLTLLLFLYLVHFSLQLQIILNSNGHSVKLFRVLFPLIDITNVDIINRLSRNAKLYKVWCEEAPKFSKATSKHFASTISSDMNRYIRLVDLRCYNRHFWDHLASIRGTERFPLHLTELGLVAPVAFRKWLPALLQQMSQDPSTWVNWTSCGFFVEIDRSSLQQDERFKLWKLLQPECLRNLRGSAVSSYLVGLQEYGVPDAPISLLLELFKSPKVLDSTKVALVRENLDKHLKTIESPHEMLFWSIRAAQLGVHVHKSDAPALLQILENVKAILSNPEYTMATCPFAVRQFSRAIFKTKIAQVMEAWLQILGKLDPSELVCKALFYMYPFTAMKVRPLEERLIWVRNQMCDDQDYLDSLLYPQDLIRLLLENGDIKASAWTPNSDISAKSLSLICTQILLYYRSSVKFPVQWALDGSFTSIFEPKHPCACINHPNFVNAGLTIEEIYNELFCRQNND